MKQQTFAAGDFERYRKLTRREQFLMEMNEVVPWKKLCKHIEPFYPKVGNGRPPVGLERMLRIYFLQYWFNLSNPGAEETLYESRSMCRFVGIDLGRGPVPDETTILNFRHLLEQHALGEALFQAVGEYLQERGLRIVSGTIVDATIISAPSSTKNKAKARDPEMHSTRKGRQWYFGTHQLLSQLGQRLLSMQGRQRHLRFELRRVITSFSLHVFSPTGFVYHAGRHLSSSSSCPINRVLL